MVWPGVFDSQLELWAPVAIHWIAACARTYWARALKDLNFCRFHKKPHAFDALPFIGVEPECRWLLTIQKR